MLDSSRLWRLPSSQPAPYSEWLQISAGSFAEAVTGVVTQPGAIWQGAMFIQTFHVRVCSSPLPSGECSTWEDARNATGGLVFEGPRPSGNLTSDGYPAPNTGSSGYVRAFFQAPVVASLVRIYPFGACTWVCGMRAGLLAYSPPPAPPLG